MTTQPPGKRRRRFPYIGVERDSGADGRAHEALASADGDGAVVVLGDNYGVITTSVVHVREAAAWPVRIGRVPDLASSFQVRPDTVGEVTGTRVVTGSGGVGKTQLAAWYAHHAAAAGADLVMWVDATSTEQIVSTYAAAAGRARVQGVRGADPVADAIRLLEWLAVTDRTWLIVLDDVQDPAHLRGWWPPSLSSSGRTVVTTRRRDAALSGSGRAVTSLEAFDPRSSLRYLEQRLSEAGCADLADKPVELAAAMGHLPLALSHASAFMIDRALPCSAYLDRFRNQAISLQELLPQQADADEYGRAIGVSLMLSLTELDREAPLGAASLCIAIAALLDPNGHPQSLWATDEIRGILDRHGIQEVSDGTEGGLWSVLSGLHRHSLVLRQTEGGPRGVQIHALTARSAREAHPLDSSDVLAVADALRAIWPAVPTKDPELSSSLRSNVSALRANEAQALWSGPESAHPILFLAGTGLGDSGHFLPAAQYFGDLADEGVREAGGTSTGVLAARHQRGRWLVHAGLVAAAADELTTLLQECMTTLGPDHHETLTVRHNLARCMDQSGDHAAALTIFTEVVLDRSRIYGPHHRATLLARLDCAITLGQSGDPDGAASELEKVHRLQVGALGADDPDTLTTLGNLARWRGHAGDASGALDAFMALVPLREAALGSDHPHSLSARRNVAFWQWRLGDVAAARATYAEVLADQRRLLGEDHVDTLLTAHEVADLNGDIEMLESVLSSRRSTLGGDHPQTMETAARLASWRSRESDPTRA